MTAHPGHDRALAGGPEAAAPGQQASHDGALIRTWRGKTMKMQLAVELDDAERDEFHRWVEAVASTVNPGQPQLTPGQAVRALIRAAVGSQPVTAAVIDQLKIEAMT